MKSGRVYAAAICLAAATICQNSEASNYEIKTSLGYDFISQEYFLDSVTTDSTLSLWQLKTDYLDELRGRISFRYWSGDRRELELQSSFEQSNELFRIRLFADWRPKLGNNKLGISAELERRDRYKGVSKFGDSYLFGYTRAFIKIPVSAKVTSKIQFMSEFVRFDSTSEFSFDYYRFGPKIGLTKSFAGFSFLDVNLFLVARQVPDSAELDYLNFGLDGSFFGLMESGDFDLYARFERKDYSRADKQDDHFRIDFDNRGKINIGGNSIMRIELSSDFVFYSPDDQVNFDYNRHLLALLAGYQKDGWEVAIGPEFGLLLEQEGSLNTVENYFEIGGRIDLELLKAGRFFGSVESILGYRNLKIEDQLQTNFVYERITTIGNFQLGNGLNLNWLFSAEWEWHDLRQENSQIFLLSSSLSYSL
ncbi:MAG: hypothetical protein V3S17_08930 [candidate division Zixibacteria bacterium]